MTSSEVGAENILFREVCRLVWVYSDIFLSLFLDFIVSREEVCLPLGHFLAVWVVIVLFFFFLDDIEQCLI